MACEAHTGLQEDKDILEALKGYRKKIIPDSKHWEMCSRKSFTFSGHDLHLM